MQDTLIEGVAKFTKEDFFEYQKLFLKLGNSQTPHTLFIGCSDSRLVPNLITNTLPGELFMIRNIANLVPPYRVSVEYAASTAAIEYAVVVLGVKKIVVCGHSNCGGCSALFMPEEKLNEIPNVKKWLELAEPIKEKILTEYRDADNAKKAEEAEKLNVIEQVKHLRSYPFIQEKIDANELKLYGWYYVIETGNVYDYDFDAQEYRLIK